MKHSPLVVICVVVAISTAKLSSLAANNASGGAAQRSDFGEGGPVSTLAPVDNNHEWAIVTVPQANAYTKRGKEIRCARRGIHGRDYRSHELRQKKMAVYRMVSLTSSFILDIATLKGCFEAAFNMFPPRCSSYASVQPTWRLKNEN